MPHRHWTSRKFLLSLSVQVTAIAVLLWPEHESAIVEVSRSATALLVMLLSSLGYVSAEAAIDRRDRPTSPDTSDTAADAP
ncbi:MAG: hypothetical protein AAGA25_00365 [Planctomycetota bacterium]